MEKQCKTWKRDRWLTNPRKRGAKRVSSPNVCFATIFKAPENSPVTVPCVKQGMSTDRSRNV